MGHHVMPRSKSNAAIENDVTRRLGWRRQQLLHEAHYEQRGRGNRVKSSGIRSVSSSGMYQENLRAGEGLYRNTA